MENVETVIDNGDEMIKADTIYYDLKTGEQVRAIKQSPNEKYWFTERIKDQKKLILPAWGLAKEPEAYSEEGQRIAKKKAKRRREAERQRKLDELG